MALHGAGQRETAMHEGNHPQGETLGRATVASRLNVRGELVRERFDLLAKYSGMLWGARTDFAHNGRQRARP